MKWLFKYCILLGLLAIIVPVLRADPSNRLYTFGFQEENWSYIFVRHNTANIDLHYRVEADISEDLCYWARFEYLFAALSPSLDNLEAKKIDAEAAEKTAIEILQQFSEELKHISTNEQDALLAFVHFKTKHTARELLQKHAPLLKRRAIVYLAWKHDVNLSIKSGPKEELIYKQWLTHVKVSDKEIFDAYTKFLKSDVKRPK